MNIKIYGGNKENYKYMSKKVWSLESKLSSEICSQKSCSCVLLMESPKMLRLRASAPKSSPANSLESLFIPVRRKLSWLIN